jgi:hypothetical protein
LPTVRRGFAVAQDEDDEHEPGGDEERAKPVNAAVHLWCSAGALTQRRVGADRGRASDQADDANSRDEEECRSPSRSAWRAKLL